jgi:hypothetical protein
VDAWFYSCFLLMSGGLRCCVLDDKFFFFFLISNNQFYYVLDKKLIRINEFNNLIYIITFPLRVHLGL